ESGYAEECQYAISVEQCRFTGHMSKTRTGALHDFPDLLPCQNIFDPIHGDWVAHAISIRIVLAYEKNTTVFYQRVSQCSRVNVCRHSDFRGPTFPDASGRKSPRAF